MNGRLESSVADDGHAISGECAFTDEHAAGFALGALDRFERGLVEQHLRWCDRCRDIIQAAENVTALLPFLSPPVAPPSDSVRAALMERITGDVAGPIVEVPPVSSRPVPFLSVPAPAAEDEAKSTPRRWTRVLPAALVAPLAIALIVVSVWANSLQNTIDEQESNLANQQPLNGAIASGNGVQMYSMVPHCTECTGSSRLGVDMDDSVGMLVAWNLDPKMKHSVWCVDGKGDRKWISALDVDSNGGAMQTFAFPGNASSYAEVYIARDDGSIAYMTNIATPPSGGADADQVAPSTPASDPGR
ncbi:MAG: hypothetical protein M3440_15040 [Chloroflexota bacterium]|nr:hypothetical protein [Chloroflexota bacterium]